MRTREMLVPMRRPPDPVERRPAHVRSMRATAIAMITVAIASSAVVIGIAAAARVRVATWGSGSPDDT